MAEFTISVSQGKVAPFHDRMKDRLDHVPRNVDPRLTTRFNKELVCSENYIEEFEEVFSSSKQKNNSKQKRKDRKIDSYYDHIIKSKNGEHPFYEYCIQIGNRETNGILKTPMKAVDTTKLSDEELEDLLNDDPDEKLAREALDNAMAKLQDKYPAFHFLYIGSHGDEPNGTYAYHVAFIPVGSGYKTGMPERCALNKALASMGFTGNAKPYPVDQWKRDVEGMIEEEMSALGLGRTFKNEHRKRLDLPEYRYEMEMKDKADEIIEVANLQAEEIFEGFLRGALDKNKELEEWEARLEEKEARLKQKEDDDRFIKDMLDTEKRNWENTKETYREKLQDAFETYKETYREELQQEFKTYKKAYRGKLQQELDTYKETYREKLQDEFETYKETYRAEQDELLRQSRSELEDARGKFQQDQEKLKEDQDNYREKLQDEFEASTKTRVEELDNREKALKTKEANISRVNEESLRKSQQVAKDSEEVLNLLKGIQGLEENIRRLPPEQQQEARRVVQEVPKVQRLAEKYKDTLAKGTEMMAQKSRSEVKGTRSVGDSLYP